MTETCRTATSFRMPTLTTGGADGEDGGALQEADFPQLLARFSAFVQWMLGRIPGRLTAEWATELVLFAT